MQPDMKTHPMLGRVFVSGWRVDGVGGGEPAEHKKRALWDVFYLVGVGEWLGERG